MIFTSAHHTVTSAISVQQVILWYIIVNQTLSVTDIPSQNPPHRTLPFTFILLPSTFIKVSRSEELRAFSYKNFCYNLETFNNVDEVKNACLVLYCLEWMWLETCKGRLFFFCEGYGNMSLKEEAKQRGTAARMQSKSTLTWMMRINASKI